MESVKWLDMEHESIAVLGEHEAVTIRCEQWPHRQQEWSATAWVGRGAQAVCIYASGTKVQGHPSREAAKADAVAGLRAWLAGVFGVMGDKEEKEEV